MVFLFIHHVYSHVFLLVMRHTHSAVYLSCILSSTQARHPYLSRAYS